MSRENGKTFAGTIAARNKKTVSGNLWKQYEQFYAPKREQCLDILSDLKDLCNDLNTASIQAMAGQCHRLVNSMGDLCMSLINSVENEEDNANLHTEDVLTPPKGEPSCESNSSSPVKSPVKSEENTEESSRLDSEAIQDLF